MIRWLARLMRRPLIEPAGACKHGQLAWWVDGRFHHETGQSTTLHRVLESCDRPIYGKAV